MCLATTPHPSSPEEGTTRCGALLPTKESTILDPTEQWFRPYGAPLWTIQNTSLYICGGMLRNLQRIAPLPTEHCSRAKRGKNPWVRFPAENKKGHHHLVSFLVIPLEFARFTRASLTLPRANPTKKNTRRMKTSFLPRAFSFVIPLGFEPKAHSLEGCCSIQLSYGTNTICA